MIIEIIRRNVRHGNRWSINDSSRKQNFANSDFSIHRCMPDDNRDWKHDENKKHFALRCFQVSSHNLCNKHLWHFLNKVWIDSSVHENTGSCVPNSSSSMIDELNSHLLELQKFSRWGRLRFPITFLLFAATTALLNAANFWKSLEFLLFGNLNNETRTILESFSLGNGEHCYKVYNFLSALSIFSQSNNKKFS